MDDQEYLKKVQSKLANKHVDDSFVKMKNSIKNTDFLQDANDDNKEEIKDYLMKECKINYMEATSLVFAARTVNQEIKIVPKYIQDAFNKLRAELHAKIDSKLDSKVNQAGSQWIGSAETPSYSDIVTDNKNRGLIVYVNDVFNLETEYQIQQFETDSFEQQISKVEIENKQQKHSLFKKIIESIGLRDEFISVRQQESLSRPDFMFVEKNAPKNINPIYSSFVLELLELGKNIDDKHIGKLIHYNREILTCNPTREFIISAVSNLHEIMFIKTERSANDHGRFFHEFSQRYNFWRVGIKYLKQLIEKPRQAGFNETSQFIIKIPRMVNNEEEIVNYRLHRFIGKGITARVYSLIACDQTEECLDMVVKIFTNQMYFENETEIMDKITEIEIKNNSNEHNNIGNNSNGSTIKQILDDKTRIYDVRNLSDKFIHRVVDNPKTLSIVYTPRGKPIQRPLTRTQFEKMFGCVRELLNLGIIHRDITPSHFLSAKTASGIENIFLIDFGSATFIEEWNLNRSNYRGSVHFAATSILDSIVNNKGYKPHWRHDLESFVKTFYILNLGEKIRFGNESSDKMRFNSALNYWKRFEENADLYWRDALDITKEETSEPQMLDKLFRHLYDNFQMFKVIDDDKYVDKYKYVEKPKKGEGKQQLYDDDDSDDEMHLY